MEHEEIPIQRRLMEMRNSDDRKRWIDFWRFSSVVAMAINLVGCAASIGLPTARESAAISAGEKTIVLLRLECTVQNQPYEPFRHSLGAEFNIGLGLGSFETGGRPKFIDTLRFLSPESRREGWTYFVLSPNIYYLAVYPPRRTDVTTHAERMQRAPRWRIDVPPNAKLVYVGTLRLADESNQWISLTFPQTAGQIPVSNEQELASKLLATHFPGMGELQVVLIKPYEGEPIILRSPLPAPAR